MKKIIKKLIVLSILLCPISVYCKLNQTLPEIHNGILDLSEFDFNITQQISLDGDWEFYWGKLLYPNDFQANGEASPGFIYVPGEWNQARDPITGKKVGSSGYATYRLRIKLPEKHPPLMLDLKDQKTAYQLYVNQELLYKDGIVGINKKSTVPSYFPTKKMLPTGEKYLTLIFHIANYHHSQGGLWNSIKLGSINSIENSAKLQLALELFLIGMNLVMAIYHLTFFIFYRKVYLLYYSIAALLIMLRTATTGGRFILALFPDISWQLLFKLEYLSYYLMVPTAVLFFASIFHWSFPKRALHILLPTALLFIIHALVGSSFWISYTINYFHIISFVALILIFYVILKALARKEDGVLFYLIGCIPFFGTILYDIIIVELFRSSSYISSYGFCAFSLCQAIFLATRFSKDHEQLKLLSEEQELIINERTQAIKLANEQKITFFINIAHETKTPLTLMKNYLNKYIEKEGTTSELEIISNNLNKLMWDTANYLDTNKFEANRFIFNHDQTVNLTDFLEEKYLLFNGLAEKKKIDFKKNLTKNLYIKADPCALDRITNNLLDNALKYTPEGGMVEMLLLPSDQTNMTFSVKDSGCGIPEEQIKNIFLPYHQISHTKETHQGMGMGLYIAKMCAESLAVPIEVKSHPGQGTTFSLLFARHYPCNDESVTADYSASLSPSRESTVCSLTELPPQKDKNTLLVVEDNTDLLAYLHSILIEEYNVCLARHGEEALQRLMTMPTPELILSDIMMPVMDGYNFIEQLTKNKKYDTVPFIFLTARVNEKDKLQGLSRGAIDYICKPFSKDELILKIKSIISNRKKSINSNIKHLKNHVLNYMNELEQSDESVLSNEDKLADFCRDFQLSTREQEIIGYITDGHSNKEIADKLFRSIKTIEYHISNIYAKLQITSRMELIELVRNYKDA